MKIAMIHYHLNRGGVTQVIVSQLKALNGQVADDARLPVALLYGGRSDGLSEKLSGQFDRLELSLHPVAELDYDNVRPHIEDLSRQLSTTFDRLGFRPEETVVHVHNHALGKNVALPGAISTLASMGYAFLLQTHDFAEDFRPDNYRQLASLTGDNDLSELPGILYPQSPQIHYAILNGRDCSILLDAGVAQSRLHVLPNSVPDIGPLPPRDEARHRAAERLGIPTSDRLVLYPVRGIRRKNLGEALLWSAIAKGTDYFGLTLAPLNPIEKSSYERWKQCAAENNLRWAFEMGGPGGLDYLSNLAAADLILTTSVAEGFGFVFLETWLAACSLVGRDLPEITTDFVESGIRFPGLEPNLWIPIEWLDEDRWREEIADSFRAVLGSYGQALPAPQMIDHEIDKLICNGRVDFAHCGVSTQRSLIKKVASEAASREVLLNANRLIGAALTSPTDSDLVHRNAEIVREKYSVTDCGRRLAAIYDQVQSSNRDDQMKPLKHGCRILERFLSLPRFHQLRVEP